MLQLITLVGMVHRSPTSEEGRVQFPLLVEDARCRHAYLIDIQDRENQEVANQLKEGGYAALRGYLVWTQGEQERLTVQLIMLRALTDSEYKLLMLKDSLGLTGL